MLLQSHIRGIKLNSNFDTARKSDPFTHKHIQICTNMQKHKSTHSRLSRTHTHTHTHAHIKLDTVQLPAFVDYSHSK